MKKVYTVAELADALGIGKTLTYKLIQGDIPSLRLGRRRVVSSFWLEAALQNAAASEHPTELLNGSDTTTRYQEDDIISLEVARQNQRKGGQGER